MRPDSSPVYYSGRWLEKESSRSLTSFQKRFPENSGLKKKRLMNNGTHCYSQPGFITLQYSYHMEQGPEVAKNAKHLRTS